MPAKRHLNPFALRAMLRNRDLDVKTLRFCIRMLLPLAQESIGGYPPEQIAGLQKDMKFVRKVLREIK